MSLDDLLLAIIIIGIGLSGAYLKAEYQLHVRRENCGTPNRHRLLPDVQASRVRMEQNGLPRCMFRLPAHRCNRHFPAH